jgi:myxalamid-type nonribosomal peptide synthetase MxaA
MTKPDTSLELNQIRADLKRLVVDAFSVDSQVIPDDVPILDLGISSLVLVEGMRRVFDHFGVLVSIRRVIEGQVTLAGLALYVEQELLTQRSAKKGTQSAAQAWKIQREVPLDSTQQHIAFLTRYSNEAAAAYNEALIVRLEGDLHGPAIQAALEEAGNRYEALRTALDADSDVLTVGTGQALELVVSPVSSELLAARLAEIVSRPFEPGKRLARAELLRLSENEHILVLVGHALVLDQDSLRLVLVEIARLYRVFSQDESADPGAAPMPPCLQWADYLALGSTTAAHAAQRQAQAYWESVFADGVPRLELPCDLPRPPIKKYTGARLALALDAGLQHSLKCWTKTHGIAVESILLAACTAFVHRLSGSQDLVMGVESEPLYLDTGLPAFARIRSTLPVRFSFDPALSFGEYVRAQEQILAEANAHKVFSFTDLIRTLQAPRDQSRSALFTTAFGASSQLLAPDFAGVKATFLLPPSAGARYDLELIALTGTQGIQLVCEYSSELFEETCIARWLQGIQALLSAALQDGARACGDLPVLTAAEQDLVLYQWNDTGQPFPHEKTVLDLIWEQASLHPDQNALRFGEQILTYSQMCRRVEAIAGALQDAGAGKGQRVGVLLRRSLDLIPAMLAIWRLGAVIVPMDSGFPEQRLAFMLSEAGVQAVLTNRQLLSLLASENALRVLCIEEIGPQGALQGVEAALATGSDAALILFTSGSTGKPKGVEVRHSSLLNVLLDFRRLFEFGPDSQMLALTTVSFDISTNELYMPLLAGGQVDVGEDGLLADGLQLAERIRAHRPSHIQATPSSWKNLLAAGWHGDSSLCLLSAGEALGRELAETLLKYCGQLWNQYGPTETTVQSAACRVNPDPGKPVLIGRPLANTRLYVLDARLQPVPIGAVGELYIGGEGVSPGYWNRPELTAKRFLPDPFRPGERIYHTGDLARYLPDGQLICLGRIDDQVKIHGVRVELGEVETVLRSISGVRDAVVTPWKDANGDLQLAAHVIPVEPDGLTAAIIRHHLRQRLPEVMVPPYILFCSAFPLTANGKIHRAALPGPTPDRLPSVAAAFEPPASDTERSLAGVWAQVLGIDVGQIGRHADFMDLGGHSLLMTRLMLEVRNLFQVTFKMREFFGASRLSQFAALIDQRQQQSNISSELHQPATPARSTEWARQRMAFLAREAELPQYITPARGLTYRPGEPLQTVFLTGATGFLGAYIVAEIIKTTQAELFCLVRPKRGEISKLRIEKQMRHYDVWPQDAAWQQAWDTRLHVVEGDVTLPRMGLKDDVYETLAHQVDIIFQGAAHVNFIYPYEALRATNVLGLHEIIQFAFHRRIKPVHHLSTAAIWPMGTQYTFRERDSIDHYKLLNLGYDEAKWVGEKCLLHAAERGLPVARYRPGEVGGDSITGRCVTDHFLIASIKGFLQFGAFPQLDIEVDVAPVDYVAKAMVYIAFHRQPIGRAFHLTNPTRRTMRQALAFLRSQGYDFVELPFEALRDRLLSSPDFASNALFAYQAALEDMTDVSMQLPTYDTRDTQRELQGSGIVCTPADEKLYGTYLHYLQEIGFIPFPEALLTRV